MDNVATAELLASSWPLRKDRDELLDRVAHQESVIAALRARTVTQANDIASLRRHNAELLAWIESHLPREAANA